LIFRCYNSSVKGFRILEITQPSELHVTANIRLSTMALSVLSENLAFFNIISIQAIYYVKMFKLKNFGELKNEKRKKVLTAILSIALLSTVLAGCDMFGTTKMYYDEQADWLLQFNGIWEVENPGTAYGTETKEGYTNRYYWKFNTSKRLSFGEEYLDVTYSNVKYSKSTNSDADEEVKKSENSISVDNPYSQNGNNAPFGDRLIDTTSYDVRANIYTNWPSDLKFARYLLATVGLDVPFYGISAPSESSPVMTMELSDDKQTMTITFYRWSPNSNDSYLETQTCKKISALPEPYKKPQSTPSENDSDDSDTGDTSATVDVKGTWSYSATAPAVSGSFTFNNDGTYTYNGSKATVPNGTYSVKGSVLSMTWTRAAAGEYTEKFNVSLNGNTLTLKSQETTISGLFSDYFGVVGLELKLTK